MAYKDKEKEKAQRAKYYSEHREEKKAKFAAYHVANKEKILARHAVYSSTRRDERKIYMAKWRLANIEREKERASAWQRANPEKVVEISARHRALKYAAGGTFTSSEWKEMLIRHDYTCAYCKNKFDKLTQDHVIPLSRGGRHEASNIVPACQSCNSKKGTRLA